MFRDTPLPRMRAAPAMVQRLSHRVAVASWNRCANSITTGSSPSGPESVPLQKPATRAGTIQRYTVLCDRG